MVSFQCDACADTVKKPKLDQHRNRCHASFTCLDCSTTFRNPGEYKSHTTCVSEAEKYQGALYKGPKKNGQSQTPSQSQTPAAAPSPAPSAPTPAAEAPVASASSSIHPSRLNQLNAPEPQYPQRGGGQFGRGGGFQRGGGRGGFQRGGYGGVVERSYATDMNKMAPSTGMRSWGGSAESTPKPEEESTSTFAVGNGTSVVDKKKNKNKKGDKGGTGSKANSKHPKDQNESQTESIEPTNKKRKFDDETESTQGEESEISSKVIKRLKKKFDKLDQSGETLLKDWINNLGKDKDSEKVVNLNDVLRILKVQKKDGQFVLTL